MINCKEASRLLSQAQDTRLPLGARLRLRIHLFACDACTNFKKNLVALRKAMQRYRS